MFIKIPFPFIHPLFHSRLLWCVLFYMYTYIMCVCIYIFCNNEVLYIDNMYQLLQIFVRRI